MDTRGHVAYDGKYRKPKWVKENESERVINFYQDGEFAHLNSRNNRVIIENPFNRRKGSNTIWDHIHESDVGKYMIGVSYLEKFPIEAKEIKVQLRLLNCDIIKKELFKNVFLPKKVKQRQYAREE
jgi:hypothetical protein